MRRVCSDAWHRLGAATADAVPRTKPGLLCGVLPFFKRMCCTGANAKTSDAIWFRIDCFASPMNSIPVPRIAFVCALSNLRISISGFEQGAKLLCDESGF
jgi:hypothetical protein